MSENVSAQSGVTAERKREPGVAEPIRAAAAKRKNKLIVDGFDLVPHDVAYFGDYGCHPNDRGFVCYFENLWDKIKNWV